MTLSELCIRRPVFTTLITASCIVFGVFAYRLLPVSALPKVDFPTVEITAQLPGASPETMAASVASPIERQLSTIAGISSMVSSSSLGTTRIAVQFDLNRDIDAAALDVQTALTIAQRRLPVEMTTPPSFRKVNPGDFPILFIANISATLPLSSVHEYADTVLAQQISQIPGVAQVLVYGAQKFAVRVQVDPTAAAARGLSFDDVRTAVAKSNSSSPVGTLSGPRQSVILQASGQLEKAADYRSVVVAWRNGAPVKLYEIARVIDSVENDKVASWFNGERSIVLAIQRQPDANTVEVVDAIRAKLPVLRAQIPPAIQLETLMDRSISVRQAVFDVQETLLIAISLVILVIFLFLRSVSATLIPALAVPISLVGTCAAMYAFGFSINNMTLLALTLSVGFVVDDAIVMLENIMRHIEGGMRPFDAALKGAREIGFTIISITFSLIAVFIPVLLMGGVVGRVFREFAVTISVAIVVSGFVSLTLTPMLCARMLRGHRQGERQNLVLRAFEAGFKGWLWAYERTLDKVIAYKAVMLTVTFATIIGTVWLYIIIPKGFFPSEDTGFMLAITEGASDSSFEAMVARQGRVAAIIRQDKAVDYINSTVGVGGPNVTTNYGRIFVVLKSKAEREPASVVVQRLRRAVAAVPGMKTNFRFIQNINIGGRITKGEYQYTLQSGDTDALYRLAPEMRDKIALIPGLLEVETDLYIQNPQMTVEIDREKAAIYGITSEQIRQELYNAFGSRQVATIYTPSNDYQVILESLPDVQADPSGLSKIYLKTNVNVTGGAAIGGDGNSCTGGRRRRIGKPPGADDSAFRGHAALADGRAVAGEPSGSAAVGYHLVQPRSRLFARICGGCRKKHRTGIPTTGNHCDGLSGNRTGVPGIAQRAGYPGAGGNLCRLCRPRRLVRKFHSSDHHHLRPSIRRHRCVAHPDGVQDGSFGDCHDRHRDAGRYREEERDHDDRLRHRAQASRPLCRGCDSRGRAPSLPSDHDDDFRRDLRHAADRARHWRRRGVAPAVGNCRGWRARALPATDALHHAGGLYLSRPYRPTAQASTRAPTRGGRGTCAAADCGRGGVVPAVSS